MFLDLTIRHFKQYKLFDRFVYQIKVILNNKRKSYISDQTKEKNLILFNRMPNNFKTSSECVKLFITIFMPYLSDFDFKLT